MPIKNYTTSIGEAQTVGEIIGLLSAKGARSIQITYDDQNRPSGIGFIVMLDSVPIPFKLPCNFEGVFRSIAANYKDRWARQRFERNPESMAQSRRVAWRIIKDWVAAQMAVIEAEQASLIQVFLPYVVQGESGQTMFHRFLEHVSKTKALPSAPAEV